MGLRLAVVLLGTLSAFALGSSCGCPPPPPDQFCFQWPLPEQIGAGPGPCPDPGKAMLDIQAAGTDATGAAIEYGFGVLDAGDTRTGECCYVVQQKPPCP